MSKQLTLSATLSVIAMAALAFGNLPTSPQRAETTRDGTATAHGSLLRVLIQA